MSAKDHISYQFDEDEGPYCADCSDDMEEVMEWHAREEIHPSKRLPCVNCGAK